MGTLKREQGKEKRSGKVKANWEEGRKGGTGKRELGRRKETGREEGIWKKRRKREGSGEGREQG